MAVKIELHGRNVGLPYPYLMVDTETGLVILMDSAGTGTVMQGGSTRYYPGYHGTNWTMSKLVPFKGRVTMENA